MASKTWSAVDDYIVERLIPADAALEVALANNVRHGLPAIDVSAAQGKLLNILARMMGAKRILEIGTLGGYSTIWLARALQPGGQVVTLELEPRHAEIARANLANAGLADVVDIRIGPALKSLEAIAREAGGPFHLVFIDADKTNNRNYLTWAMKLSRSGNRHHLRQRRSRRRRSGGRRSRSLCRRRASHFRLHRKRGAARRHRHPDCRRQGL